MDAEVVAVTHLFAPERASVLELLSALSAGQWQAPTVCPGWSVKDVALHLLGDDFDLCELLAFTGEATERYLASLELFAVEESVS